MKSYYANTIRNVSLCEARHGQPLPPGKPCHDAGRTESASFSQWFGASVSIYCDSLHDQLYTDYSQIRTDPQAYTRRYATGILQGSAKDSGLAGLRNAHFEVARDPVCNLD
jgi:hypothetical protein